MKRNEMMTLPAAHRIIIVVAAALALSLSAGCIDTRQVPLAIDTFTPDYAPPPAAGVPALPVIIRVERFTVAPELNTSRMAYKEAPHRIAFDPYHQWQGNPADIVAYYTARDLRATERFAAVAAPGSGIQPSHRIDGVVAGFHEVAESGGRWFAELTLSLTLQRAREPDVSRRIVLQKTYHHREALSERTPRGVAAGMGRCLGAVSEAIARDVYERLAAGQ